MRAELHDSHNIEIKTQMNIAKPNQEAHLEVYLFVPSSFEAKSLAKNDIFDDIRSKMRFTIQEATQTHSHIMLMGLERIQSCLEQRPVNAGELLRNVQTLANVINEKYKSILDTQNLEELLFMYGIIERTRAHYSEANSAGTNIFQDYDLISLFDEFISQNLIQLIISLEKKAISSEAMTRIKIREASYREEKSYNVPQSSTSEDLEKKLTRMSYMKKFFQSTSFVDIQRVDYFRRARVIVKLFGRALSKISKSKFPFLNIKLDTPDYFSKLAINKRPFAKTSEWINIYNTKNITTEISSTRQRFIQNTVDNLAMEDVISYRKKIKLFSEPELPNNLKNFKSLQDTVRINFERYLKLMDDPLKEFLEVDRAGALMTFQSNKVYNFYVHACVKLVKQERRHSKVIQNEEHTYRIVLNKNGIVRVETIELN